MIRCSAQHFAKVNTFVKRITVSQHNYSLLQSVFSAAPANITAAGSPMIQLTKNVQSGVAMTSSVLFVFVQWISMMANPKLVEDEFEKYPLYP